MARKTCESVWRKEEGYLRLLCCDGPKSNFEAHSLYSTPNLPIQSRPIPSNPTATPPCSFPELAAQTVKSKVWLSTQRARSRATVGENRDWQEPWGEVGWELHELRGPQCE